MGNLKVFCEIKRAFQGAFERPCSVDFCQHVPVGLVFEKVHASYTCSGIENAGFASASDECVVELGVLLVALYAIVNFFEIFFFV